MTHEYKVLECSVEALENHLNEYAKYGWRAWRVVPPRLETARNYVLVFERKLPTQYIQWGSSLGALGDEVQLDAD